MKTHGFTLLETMLALMIFSMAVVGLVTAINGTGAASIEARQMRDIQARVDTLLLETTRNPSTAETLDVMLREGAAEYHLQKIPAGITNAAGEILDGLFTVKVTARWKSDQGTEEITADTLVYPKLFHVEP